MKQIITCIFSLNQTSVRSHPVACDFPEELSWQSVLRFLIRHCSVQIVATIDGIYSVHRLYLSHSETSADSGVCTYYTLSPCAISS